MTKLTPQQKVKNAEDILRGWESNVEYWSSVDPPLYPTKLEEAKEQVEHWREELARRKEVA